MDGSEPARAEPLTGAANNAAKNPLKDPAAEAVALEAAGRHHAGMLQRVDALLATLDRAVKAGDTVAEHDAHSVLVEWCETELVPHALAEEAALYPGARQQPEGRLLVEGLLADHAVTVGLVEELRGAAGVDAASVARALRHVFAAHVDKENRLLLPLIVASPGLSLVRAVEGLSELVGDAHVHGAGAGRGGTV